MDVVISNNGPVEASNDGPISASNNIHVVRATGDSGGMRDNEGDSKDSSDDSKGDGQRATGECNG